jgi:hypothetical protein
MLKEVAGVPVAVGVREVTGPSNILGAVVPGSSTSTRVASSEPGGGVVVLLGVRMVFTSTSALTFIEAKVERQAAPTHDKLVLASANVVLALT